MHDPKQRRPKGNGARRSSEALTKLRQEQAPANDAKQKEPAREMNRDIRQVIAFDTKTVTGVIEREREIKDRPRRHRRFTRRRKHLPYSPKRADTFILNDAQCIVENKRPAQAIGIRRDARQNQNARQAERAKPTVSRAMWIYCNVALQYESVPDSDFINRNTLPAPGMIDVNRVLSRGFAYATGNKTPM
ncbi:MAG TPA: hypothetical protein VNT79_09540 [Phycisphaerae bacterium]|nr:hypothetical protein [Phycisphaerae bacterium]